MKSLSVYVAAFAIALGALVGCEDSISTAPSSSLVNTGTNAPQQSGRIDASLETIRPDLLIAKQSTGVYSLAFEGYASGQIGEPDMEALRSLRSVTFEVHAADGLLLATRSTEEIVTSGIKDELTGASSLTASAGIDWVGEPAPGSYVVMIVRSDKGMISRQKAFTDDVRN